MLEDELSSVKSRISTKMAAKRAAGSRFLTNAGDADKVKSLPRGE
jgi:hypothetical protein